MNPSPTVSAPYKYTNISTHRYIQVYTGRVYMCMIAMCVIVSHLYRDSRRHHPTASP